MGVQIETEEDKFQQLVGALMLLIADQNQETVLRALAVALPSHGVLEKEDLRNLRSNLNNLAYVASDSSRILGKYPLVY